jgi:ubiquitin carboxyl-terminal hydrolase 48
MLRSKAALKCFFNLRPYLRIISDVFCRLTWIDFAEYSFRYWCSRCQSLEDATRQLILQKLPPVLHFSLLRFVFDVTTLERKKRKHNVSFPVVLDMNKFVRNQDSMNEENAYELKGVLVHKGSSAYHGHYEAMVFDVT